MRRIVPLAARQIETVLQRAGSAVLTTFFKEKKPADELAPAELSLSARVPAAANVWRVIGVGYPVLLVAAHGQVVPRSSDSRRR